MKVYRKIIKGFAKVSFPDDFPEQCHSMIWALCQRNSEERLTMGSLGVQNFKDHAWYRGFGWGALEELVLPAPYVPSITEEVILARARRRTGERVPAAEGQQTHEVA